jgi:integrase
VRAVPLQAIALEALELMPASLATALLFPSPSGGYLHLHNFRTRAWKPAQRAAGIEPVHRLYDLRHTFATFALRAGVSTFELSRYMGTSLTMRPPLRPPGARLTHARTHSARRALGQRE